MTPNDLGPIALWTGIGFFCGSLMLAYWLGSLVLRRDLRAVGDGNPGATNVIKAGGLRIGLLAMALDVIKGMVPVGIAVWIVGIHGAGLVLVALAPIFGHAFSPFLRFKGGKAVAVSGGVWIALTAWEIPTFAGILLGLWFSIIEVSGWAIVMLLTCLLAYMILAHPDPTLLTIMIINSALLVTKYRADLRQFPRPRAWLRRRLGMA